MRITCRPPANRPKKPSTMEWHQVHLFRRPFLHETIHNLPGGGRGCGHVNLGRSGRRERAGGDSGVCPTTLAVVFKAVLDRRRRRRRGRRSADACDSGACSCGYAWHRLELLDVLVAQPLVPDHCLAEVQILAGVTGAAGGKERKGRGRTERKATRNTQGKTRVATRSSRCPIPATAGFPLALSWPLYPCMYPSRRSA